MYQALASGDVWWATAYLPNHQWVNILSDTKERRVGWAISHLPVSDLP